MVQAKPPDRPVVRAAVPSDTQRSKPSGSTVGSTSRRVPDPATPSVGSGTASRSARAAVDRRPARSGLAFRRVSGRPRRGLDEPVRARCDRPVDGTPPGHLVLPESHDLRVADALAVQVFDAARAGPTPPRGLRSGWDRARSRSSRPRRLNGGLVRVRRASSRWGTSQRHAAPATRADAASNIHLLGGASARAPDDDSGEGGPTCRRCRHSKAVSRSSSAVRALRRRRRARSAPRDPSPLRVRRPDPCASTSPPARRLLRRRDAVGGGRDPRRRAVRRSVVGAVDSAPRSSGSADEWNNGRPRRVHASRRTGDSSARESRASETRGLGPGRRRNGADDQRHRARLHGADDRRRASVSTSGSATRGRCSSRIRRTSRRSARPSSATWRGSSPSSTAAT